MKFEYCVSVHTTEEEAVYDRSRKIEQGFEVSEIDKLAEINPETSSIDYSWVFSYNTKEHENIKGKAGSRS